MKIIALPDIHGAVGRLLEITEIIAEVDLVLLPGDLTTGGPASAAAGVVETVRRINPAVLAIPGNWDPPEVGDYLSTEKINLDRTHLFWGGLAFGGVGGGLPGPFSTPNELDEADFERACASAVFCLSTGTPLILLCHEPPYGTLVDLAQGQIHVGSRAVRRFIEERQPLLCFSGHIHEAIGIDRIGRTQVINPGPLAQGRYAFAEIDGSEVQRVEIIEFAASS
jgi:Icc-related predicted phosphoesterase